MHHNMSKFWFSPAEENKPWTVNLKAPTPIQSIVAGAAAGGVESLVIVSIIYGIEELTVQS